VSGDRGSSRRRLLESRQTEPSGATFRVCGPRLNSPPVSQPTSAALARATTVGLPVWPDVLARLTTTGFWGSTPTASGSSPSAPARVADDGVEEPVPAQEACGQDRATVWPLPVRATGLAVLEVGADEERPGQRLHAGQSAL
jgi:hypothetical protein